MKKIIIGFSIILILNFLIFIKFYRNINNLQNEYEIIKEESEDKLIYNLDYGTRLLNSALFKNKEKNYLEKIIIDVKLNYQDILTSIKENIILNNTKIDRYNFNNSRFSQSDIWFNVNNMPPKDSLVIESTNYDVKHFGILEKNNNKNLLIYIQGHSGHPYQYDYFFKMKEKFKKNKFDILSLSITNIGYNSISTPSFPSKNGNFKIENKTYSHNYFENFYDKKNPTKKPISILLTGNYEIIKRIIPDYENVILVGFSGGAVWGTIYSALIDKIKINFDIDGTFPHFYNVIVNPIWANDFEYNQNYLWKNYDLWHFYMLSTMNFKNGIEERYIYNIYNSETYKFKFLYPFMKELNLIENHDVYLFKNQTHEISNDIENLILDISSKIIN